MAITLTILANLIDADVDYQTTPADYIELDLENDYLIWTEGDLVVKDRMEHEPTANELNTASTIIDELNPKTVDKCLIMDASHNWESSYYTYLVAGMGSDSKRYSFCFSFDGATASEPQLEAWDDSDHDSSGNHVLGKGTPANSFVKASCTTSSNPSVSGWNSIANASNVLLLNNGSGALSALGSGETSQELYANLKIVIPAGYSTPGAETFVLSVRYTWS